MLSCSGSSTFSALLNHKDNALRSFETPGIVYRTKHLTSQDMNLECSSRSASHKFLAGYRGLECTTLLQGQGGSSLYPQTQMTVISHLLLDVQIRKEAATVTCTDNNWAILKM